MLRIFSKPALYVSLANVALLSSLPSFAQEVRPPMPKRESGEVIMAANGAVVAPWKEFDHCDLNKKCVMLVVNPSTGEIARANGRWSTRFAATGNGKEVHRAESAIAKAKKVFGGID